MKLAVRTSSGAYGVGLIDAAGALVAVQEGDGSSASPGDLTATLLRRAGLGPGDVSGVLVDLGPGGLSATRVGVSFANAFAHGTGARLAGVSALDLQCHQARADLPADLPLLSLRPAPGGQVFWGLCRGTGLAEAGCDRLADLLPALQARLGRLAVTGPLARLRGFDAALPCITPLPVDPPALAGFAHVPQRPAICRAGVALLEPLTDARALLAPPTDPEPAR